MPKKKSQDTTPKRYVGFADMTVRVCRKMLVPAVEMVCEVCGERVSIAHNPSLDDLRTDYAVHLFERHL